MWNKGERTNGSYFPSPQLLHCLRCESAVPWHNLASNETDAEHFELTEYGYEDIESCIGKQTLISNLLRQPTVQRLKSDNVRVN